MTSLDSDGIEMTRQRETLMVGGYEEDGQYAFLSLPVLRDHDSDWKWQDSSMCQRFPDMDFFNVQSTSNVTKCKIVCDACVVKPQCLDFALRNMIADGLWGGLTPRERKDHANTADR